LAGVHCTFPALSIDLIALPNPPAHVPPTRAWIVLVSTESVPVLVMGEPVEDVKPDPTPIELTNDEHVAAPVTAMSVIA
jgi:hypothetical protein